MIFANLGVSMPVFVLGLLLAYLFAIVLKDTPLSLPPSGRLSTGVRVESMVEVWGLEDMRGPPRALLDFLSGLYIPTAIVTGQWHAAVDAFRHLLLPALALSTIPMAIIARITRSSLLDVLGQDYVRTARAKGLAESLVVAKHTLKNAAIPIVTITGLQFGSLLGGGVVTETVFAWPGMGRLAIQSIYNRDYPVVQCAVVISALTFIVLNFLIDLFYGLLDPRVRRA
jgi:peptide/nickel transport system permease protein